MLWRFRSRPRSRGSTCGHTGYTVWPLSALCHSRAADQRLLRIENLPEGHFTQLGRSCHSAAMYCAAELRRQADARNSIQYQYRLVTFQYAKPAIHVTAHPPRAAARSARPRANGVSVATWRNRYPQNGTDLLVELPDTGHLAFLGVQGPRCHAAISRDECCDDQAHQSSHGLKGLQA